MRKSQTSNPKNVPSFDGPRYRPRWLAAGICFFLGTWIAVTLFDFSPRQSRQFEYGGQSAWNGTDWVIIELAKPEPNLGGPWGAEMAWWSLHLTGVSAWMVPVFLICFSWVAVRRARRLVTTRFIAMLLAIATFSGLAAMVESQKSSDYFTMGLGGLVGQLIYLRILKETVGVVGAGLLLGTVYFLCLLFIFTPDIGTEFERIVASFHNWRTQRARRAVELAEQKRKEKATREKAVVAPKPGPGITPPGKKQLTIPKTKDDIAREAATAKIVDSSAAISEISKPPSKSPLTKAPAEIVVQPASGSAAAVPGSPTPPVIGKLNIVKLEEPRKAKTALASRSEDNYEFPPLSLLREPAKVDVGSSEEEHRRNAENLLRILAEFGVEVTLGEIHVGPVITRYEVIPAPGVRVEKIAGLDKNIALGMKAQSVRILAPIPGKAAVGVEVPNQKPTQVGLREILESEDWANAKAELPIALGKDVSGKPLVSDLTKMPHLLIAGATGSGKSVCVNAIIASILYSASPRNVRLLMVDPKIVELKIFNSLPHMLIPVVTEAKKVPAALKWLLREMENRYQIFAKAGARNISAFNSRKKPAKGAAPGETQTKLDVGGAAEEVEVPDHLPYVVAIIDELADLMMIAPAEVENSVARVAQLARAAGIHIIIATQRPSVNVVTGVIKANLPSRIAFQVASQVDSRTIIDGKGADTLIGRGDMLFMPPGTSKLVRAQGAFVSDEEINRLVEFQRRNGPPQYAHEVQAEIDRDPDAEEAGEGSDDTAGESGDDVELYKHALEVIKTTRRASTSMLQRRLRIGYNRAARIMELMEQKGVVGPENGAQPREILADLDKL